MLSHPKEHRSISPQSGAESWTRSTTNWTAGGTKKGGTQGGCEKKDGQGFKPHTAGMAAEKSRRAFSSRPGILDARQGKGRDTGRMGVFSGVFLLMMVVLVQTALGADPGHAAGSIGSGTFESGNYTLPDTLEVINTLNVSNGVLYVGSSGNVGVGTTGNLGSVGSWQKGRGI